MAKNTNKKAFTIVELMLAVAFLGTLLLSIAMLTIQLINIYTKGATMRAINSTGTAIMKDIRSAITSSESLPSNLDRNRSDYLFRDKDVASESRYGAFCTGSYTYIWNYRNAMLDYRDLSNNDEDYIAIRGYLSAVYRPYALVRLKDSSCSHFKDIKAGQKMITDVRENELTILLDGKKSGEGTDLAIYDFSVITATRSTLNNKGLYDISFVLGTMNGKVDISSSSNYCSRASDASTDYQARYEDVSMNFCSVNRFEFAVRQSGLQTK